MGPELLRVKDLARLSNSFGKQEYDAALKVLRRVFVRKDHGIVIFRHAAGREIVPSSTRSISSEVSEGHAGFQDDGDDLGSCISPQDNELSKHSLCQGKVLLSAVGSMYAVDDAEQILAIDC
jgi:hypothetical protein